MNYFTLNDLSNYATKADIKNISHVDTSSFALKTNLANLKSEVDKLDIDKLKAVHTDLSKLSNVVKNDVVKKDVYDKLVTKVNNIIRSRFAIKTKYDTDKSELENKILILVVLLKRLITILKSLKSKIEGKIPNISNLATKAALTTVENKIPSISNLVNTKVREIENKLNNHSHDKYIDTSEFNKLAADVLNVRLVQANLVIKTYFDAKLLSLTEKLLKIKQKIY